MAQYDKGQCIFLIFFFTKYFNFIHNDPDFSGKKALNLELLSNRKYVTYKDEVILTLGLLFAEILALNSGYHEPFWYLPAADPFSSLCNLLFFVFLTSHQPTAPRFTDRCYKQ